MVATGLSRAIVTGLISGYAGTLAMDPVTTRLAQMASPQDKKQEEAVSPGVAYDVAAKRMARVVGVQLDDRMVKTVAGAFHYGLGIAAGELYVLLRAGTSLGPVTAGLATGFALWGGVDEGMNALFGFSAPITAYPLSTHVRGLIGHLTLGLVTAATAETLSTVYRREG